LDVCGRPLSQIWSHILALWRWLERVALLID